LLFFHASLALIIVSFQTHVCYFKDNHITGMTQQNQKLVYSPLLNIDDMEN